MRNLKHKCYGNDTDYRWFTYLPTGKTKTLAVFEWKHPNIGIVTYDSNASLSAASLRARCDLADDLGVPFFIGLTFTKDETEPSSRDCSKPLLAPAPTVYVIPGNKLAGEALGALGGASGCGLWMAAADLIQLQRHLQGMTCDLEAVRSELDPAFRNQPKIDLRTLSRVEIDWESLNQ